MLNAKGRNLCPFYALWGATGGGLGYLKTAPGTWGSLPGLPLGLQIMGLFFKRPPLKGDIASRGRFPQKINSNYQKIASEPSDQLVQSSVLRFSTL